MRNGFCKFVWNGLVLPLSLTLASIVITACSEIHTKDNVAGGSSDDAGIVAISDKMIAGVSQKGPFVSGSTVTVQELDGATLKQTGKSFKGTIKSDKGDFVINNVSLASQYAIVEVTGYYRREVGGGLILSEKSSGMITLRALTDLSDRNTVNVNLLTHLEYNRVMYLVDSGLSLHDAKNQAEAEIFKAFGIQGDFVNAEDLDIFREGEGNAALLAISIMMLRDLAEAEFTEFLAKFAEDIEFDGKWDNDTSKVEIAGWANREDRYGTISDIRENIEAWNLGPVPDFEKYVRNFWYEIYGLGPCGAEEEGVVSAVKNKSVCDYDFGRVRSNEHIAINYCNTSGYYICRNGAWVEATDIEKDFYQSGKNEDAEDGEIWKGLVTGRYYQYDEVLKEWNDPYYIVETGVRMNTNDEVLVIMGRGCTTKREGEVDTGSDGMIYVCENLKWKIAPENGDVLYGERCVSEVVGRVITGPESDKYYCALEGWVSMTDGWNWSIPKDVRFNPDIAYDSITDERDGKVYKTVKIGEQTWMAENLNYADSVETPSLKGNVWCTDSEVHNIMVSAPTIWYTYVSIVLDTFHTDVGGCTYTWAAVVDSAKLADDTDNPLDCGYEKLCGLTGRVQGICPDGWHLPDNDEWNELFAAVGGIATAGKVLKSQTGWDYNGSGTDDFGFSAIPISKYLDNGHRTMFWSASEKDEISSYLVAMGYSEDLALFVDDYEKLDQYPVRCLKD
jgi:uncharacterized protein (TIGR02145 family)